MKKKLSRSWQTIVPFILLFLVSCSKKDSAPPSSPPPPDPVESLSIQWKIDSLPGQAPGTGGDLFALVTVVNENNQAVLTSRKLRLSYSSSYLTEEIQLPKGNYRLTGLIVVDNAGRAKFAAPVLNSPRASLVSRPIPIGFSLPHPSTTIVNTQVLRIAPGDSEAAFGYPGGSFNDDVQGPPPGNDNPGARIRLKTAIKVGDILYDSIPGTVLYTYWKADQQSFGRYIPLTAGANEIELAANATRHHFRITKWGMDYELALTNAEVQPGHLYLLGGVKEPRRLKSELVYKLVNGEYKPDTRTVFTYHPDGRLSGIEYFGKKPDNSTYLARRDVFQYAGGRVQRINMFDEANQPAGYTGFQYNAQGKINQIIELSNGITTTAILDHHNSVETGIDQVSFDVTFSNSGLGMKYYQRFKGGNLVSDNSSTTNHSTETGDYQFDNAINPYIHMGWPNLFLSHGSKNNVVSQQKHYFGSYPVAVAYGFVYKYDAEGYPVELVKQYKSYLTGQHLYTTKTVFNY